MRKRLFDKKVKKLNLVTSTIVSPSVTATVLSATTGTIVTLDGTTAGIDTVNVSSVLNVSGTLTAVTKMVIPTTPYTGSNVTYGAFYATGGQIFVGMSGAVWASAALGFG